MRLIDADALNMSNEQAMQILIPMRNMMYDQNGCPISDAVFALDKAIEALSADRSQEEWIPCSERFTSDGDNVFVTMIDEHGDTPWRYTDVAWLCNETWIANNEILFGEVIAWMPRPKPYKGGKKK